MRNKLIVLFLVMLFSSGCVTTIDRKWAAVNTRSRDANLAFAEASISFVNGVEVMITNKHGLQHEHINRDWDEFYSKYTDANGRIPQEMVKQRFAESQLDIKQLEKSKSEWVVYRNKYLAAIEQLKMSIISTEATEEEILAAKESAQAYLNSAINILGGVVAGAGAAALIAP